ncbi:transcriptional activator, TenA family [Haloterrigena turkmenica DSM 5511]|uniref:Transcriptional activator, TenA family n=1 Tax=Haloterrigena turkmenica (strain ATCC 51198 / DSM 5511 / JCM 9101 / NCIMB 13204 / VKM B-1734 / 4k) TaxID=543526 RepID=D2RWT0_HALTV|nr:thiaminase II [Haloterrigena turkmenica]ADB61581.1 transcriptional activator, TenA family [Haloterrigena turkmenica DSM 5511]
MAFSDQLLEAGSDVWAAQKEHPFVHELAAGTLDEDAFQHWVKQDYRYLLDYARVFSIAGTKARDEATMTHLLGVAHEVLDHEMDLHREFAADYGISRADLEAVEKAPTCHAYTNFLVRTAYEGSIAEIAAALYPCMQGYLDVAEHMATLAEEEHRYTPFIELYTGEDFREATAWCREFVDDCGERYPGEHDAMREAFLTSAKLEYRFWEMAYTREGWEL